MSRLKPKPGADNPPAKAKQSKLTRGPGGKFKPGNPGGPGRPSKERELEVARAESEFLKVLRKSISLDDFQAIIAVHVRSAKKGSVKSTDLLFRHLLPAATSRHSIEASLHHDWQSNADNFRVAGQHPAQVDAAMFRLIADLMEAEAREKQQPTSQSITRHLKPNPN